MKTMFALSILALVGFAATAMAEDITVDATAAGLGTFYVSDDGTAWEETNGCEGLQREDSDCAGEGTVTPPDSQLI